MRYFQNFKVSLYKILIIYKGERVNLQLEMPGRDSLNQVTTVNIISKVTNQIICFQTGNNEKTSVTPAIFLTNMYNLNLIIKNYQTIPNWGTKQLTFTNFKILKVKERLRKFSRLMETNKTGLINEMHNPKLVLSWNKWWNLNGVGG